MMFSSPGSRTTGFIVTCASTLPNTLGNNRFKILIPHLSQRNRPSKPSSPRRQPTIPENSNRSLNTMMPSLEDSTAFKTFFRSRNPIFAIRRAHAHQQKLNSDFELILNLVVKTCLKFGKHHQSAFFIYIYKKISG